MDVSDLLITKPGGMTCTEGLSKGIPMLFYEPIPGQEEENCEYFVRNGFGELLTDRETIDRWFKLIQEPYAAGEYRRSLLTKRNEQYNPERCSRAVLSSCSTAFYNERDDGPGGPVIPVRSCFRP